MFQFSTGLIQRQKVVYTAREIIEFPGTLNSGWRTMNKIKGTFSSFNTNFAKQLSLSATYIWELFLTKNLYENQNEPIGYQ